MATILTDFEYAVSQNVESLLWQTHSHVNSEYRKLIGRAKFNDRDVLKRKIEKLYFTFLKTSQLFYRGYLQRLAAAFDIPELERVARGVGLQPMEKVARIDVVDPNVEASVRKSAHQTLIHLGDLARYRNQMRHKGPSESALVSYSLAQQVDPNSGFAHHQMGVIAVDEKKHLNVVYHLYRAIAVAEPHPNAIPNLEAEFNNLLVPSTLASRNPKSDEDAMRDWFVKLHAYFYRGENFAAHRELEDEVMHRLELALKHEAWSEVNSDLFKMVIINLAAYAVANDKVQSMHFPKAVSPLCISLYWMVF